MQRGATAVIFDTTNDPSAVEEVENIVCCTSKTCFSALVFQCEQQPFDPYQINADLSHTYMYTLKSGFSTTAKCPCFFMNT